MNTSPTWQDFINSFTAESTLKECQDGTTRLMNLNHLGLIAIPGEDSQTFLQGQLSCDLAQLSDKLCLPGSLNTPKGRTVCTLTLAKLNNTIHMLLPKALHPSVTQLLAKYIVFSKASLEDQNDKLVCFGISGHRAEHLISKQLPSPVNDYDISHKTDLHCIKVPGIIHRYLIIAPLEQAKEFWSSLSEDSHIVDSRQWEIENIQAGIAEVTTAITEQFLPHNLNLHLTGSVNFEKGCYTGQEVIARMHYRGKLKNELYICTFKPITEANSSSTQLDGMAIQLKTSETEKNMGEIINAAMLEDGQIIALALLPKKESLEEFSQQNVLINQQEFSLNKVERPPYAIHNK